jgi:hypothetical protein
MIRPGACAGIFDQVALGDLAPALDVRRPRLQAEHVFLLELQLGASSTVTISFVVGDERRRQLSMVVLAVPVPRR